MISLVSAMHMGVAFAEQSVVLEVEQIGKDANDFISLFFT
jgi:hypothetical protein